MTYEPIQYRWTADGWQVFSIWHREWEQSQMPDYYTESDIQNFYEGHRHLVEFVD